MIKPKNPLISIIIPCLNEEKYIESTLKTIKNQKLHNFEIIIIDGLSKDNTVKIAREYADRVIVEKKRGTGAARNAGTKIAKGEILLFVDADTILPNDLTKKIHETLEQNNKISYGNVSLRFENLNIKCKLLNFYFYLQELFPITKGVYGNCFFIKKELFEKVDGFRNVICEDIELSFRLKKVGIKKDIKDTHVISNIRRFEKKGYLRTIFLWSKEYWSMFFNRHHILPSTDKYPVIR